MQGVREKNLIKLSNEEKEKFVELERWVDEYKNAPGALIMLLGKAQQLFGYLPLEVQEYIAEKLDKKLSEVYGVTTFYSFFSLFPKGEHSVKVCLGTACYVKGGKKILSAVKKDLGIGINETTPDRKFSIEVNRCMGACALSPVLRIDDDIYARVSASKVSQILSKYQ